MGGKPTLADEWVAAEEARNLRVAEERARKAEEALREARAWIKEPGQPGTIVETTEESAVLSAMMLNRFDAALAALVAERDTLREALRNFRDRGLLCDLNPTRIFHPDETVASTDDWWVSYLRQADASVRRRARAALGEQP
jgi:hypothetical protein